MADPLSVAGLVFGVISFGLQVTGGLSDYLDAVRGRTEELNSAKQQALQMKDLLLTIRDLFPQVNKNWPAPAALIERHVKSCDTELSALYTLLSELSQPASSSSGIRLKISGQKKKLTYPFNRSHISCLEKRLTDANSALRTALQVTEMNVSITSANQIRQVHDLVLSLSRLHVTQTQSASSTTARTIPQETSSRGAVLPPAPPSLLSSSIDMPQGCSMIHAARGNLSRVCSCGQSRKTSHYGRSWGYFSFSYRTSSTRRHLPDCPFSQIDGELQDTIFTIEYKGFRSLFQTAIALSLLNTRSSGGRNISPILTYYPTVDEQKAPVFRIMDLALIMVYWNDNIGEAIIKTLQYCFDSIFILYSQKRASPKDIDSDGQSAMNLAARIAMEFIHKSSIHSPGADTMPPIIANLAACGVPVTTYDSYGFTPSALLIRNRKSNSLERLVNILLSLDSDSPLYRGSRPVPPDSSLFWLLRDLRLAEASGCGPLSLAARAGDERLVLDLLKRDPRTLKELNQFGHTPLHLAINHPRCLRLILEAGGSLLETADMSSRTPLHIATSLGYNTSVQFLLASGSHITDECLDNVDESCIDILLTTLKQRRNELKVLAIENLTKSKAENLGLHEDQVLDSNAYEVQELLLKKGTYVPPKLYVGKNGWRDYCPVYTLTYYRKKTLMFDKLWALGFRDIDSCGLNGLTPLVIHRLNIEAVWWLIEHGADYWTPLSEKRSRPKSINQLLTPAHFCLVHIGQDLYENTRCTLSYNERRKWIFEKLIQVQVSDTCFSCPCFVGGCTPFKAFFDRLWDRAKYCPPQDLARWWQRSIRTVQTSLKEEDFMAALRRMTFDALRISHTCCNVYLRPLYNQKRLLTPEEADEINSEQDTLLTLFTDLLIELSQIAYEDRGGAPLIMNDPEEFWMHRWLPRITEVLDNLDGDNLTEEERSAAEAIGVVWSPQPAQVVNVEIRQPFGSEYVTREVEKIMNECMNE